MKYHLLMNGQNFLIDMAGKAAKHGFYKDFFLEAESREQAEQLAVQRIRANEDVRSIIKNAADDPPAIVLEQIAELESLDGVEAVESGRVWYREKRWWEFWK